MNYKVVVSEFPKNIEAKQVRAIRLIGKMPLKKAYAVAMYSRGLQSVVLVSGVGDKVADKICKNLASAGLHATAVKCEDRVPMVLSPEVTSAYRWSLGFIVKSAF